MIKINMKRLSSLFLCFSLLISASFLSSCHGSKGTQAFEVPDSFDSNETYEITFWAKNDTNKAQTNIYQNAISEFETLYPNIHVNLRLYTDYSKIYNDVITNISTGTTPNVCITYPDHIATYMTGSNVVVPLDELMSDSQFGLGGSELKFDGPDNGEIISEFLDECILDGSHYAVPYMRSTEACYINKDYVEALGYEIPEVLTWDFIWEVSDAATAKNDDGTYVLNNSTTMIPFIYKSTDNMMIQMLKQLDAGYSTEDGEMQIFNENTTGILNEVASHVENGAFSTFKISSYPANFLNAGQCVFAIDSTAGSTWMGSNAPLSDISEDSFVDFETVVMPIPQYDVNNPMMISQGPSICIFNKQDSGEVLASWLFTQYLLSNNVQIPYSQTEGYVPVTSLAQNSEEYQDYLSRSGEDNNKYYEVKIAASKLLLDNISNTFTTPVFNGSTSLRDAAGYLIESVCKSVRRHQVVDDSYIENLYSSAISLYRLDQIGNDMNSDLGPLSTEAVALLTSLGVVWVCIIVYFVYDKYKSRQSK